MRKGGSGAVVAMQAAPARRASAAAASPHCGRWPHNAAHRACAVPLQLERGIIGMKTNTWRDCLPCTVVYQHSKWCHGQCRHLKVYTP